MPASNDLARLETALRTSSHFPLKCSFSLKPEEFDFLSKQTEIEDAADLEFHISNIQREAYAVFPYGCIRYLAFLSCRIASVPGYDRLIKLGCERYGAILVDVGCCFGTDVRKVVADGWPMDNVIGTDIQPEFWELGHKLFRSNAETFSAMFLPGDVFDPAHLAPVSNVNATDDGTLPHAPAAVSALILPLKSLTSLNALRGHVAVIHAGSFFHLFSEDRQTALAHTLASLLSPAPGSMIVGSQAGAPHKGIRVITRAPDHTPRATTASPALSYSQFCHSPESWAELWDGQVFETGSVKVETTLVRPDNAPEDLLDYYTLYWSVTRL